MQRLDGISIDSSNVLYCEKNSAGEVTDLILNNITGDALAYGIVTAKKTSTTNATDSTGTVKKDEDGKIQTNLSGESYILDLNGSTYSYGNIVKISSGTPVFAYLNGNEVLYIAALKSLGGISKLTSTQATVSGTSYKLSDSVLVYRVDNSFNVSRLTLDDAINGGYSLSAYYDKAESEGGRIRVIIAK